MGLSFGVYIVNLYLRDMSFPLHWFWGFCLFFLDVTLCSKIKLSHVSKEGSASTFKAFGPLSHQR